MDIQARYLVFHSAVVLLAGLLVHNAWDTVTYVTGEGRRPPETQL